MFYTKYTKNKNAKTWEEYRKKRNIVNKLKKKSINNYFQERCVGGCKSVDFWKTIKPFMSKKAISSQSKIILNEDDNICSENQEVSEIFNNFYVNVANDIGKDFLFDKNNHPSLNRILGKKFHQNCFNFKPTDQQTVNKIIDKFNVKKATGVDKISVKLLKLGKQSLAPFITDLINSTISTGTFPDRLKEAQVTPIFKKKDPMIKSNYRPVSILPVPSKIFEKVLAKQLSVYFDDIFDNFLCAFRKGHGCQTTIIKLLEDWKKALDSNHYVAAILMDLSKAFGCLPNDILLCKLAAYGLAEHSVNLMSSYLSDRRQQIKISSVVSSWAQIKKGVPQGSILGPLLFNVFINDIFYFVEKCILYNYADDNTLSLHTTDFDLLLEGLQHDSKILIDWFSFNCMKANPDKFQAIAVGKRTSLRNPTFNVNNSVISCEDVVKLLGVDIDCNLTFDSHIKNICKKAGQQINVLKRIGKNLCRLSRLTIFHSFILSNFNFCPLSWHFCSKGNTEKIEKIQHRALRFVYDDYSSSYQELLTKAKLPSLHVNRMRNMAAETFKILNGIAPPVLNDLLTKRENSYNFRYSNILKIPQVKTTKFGKNSFSYAAPVLWNSLPDHFRKTADFNQFKNLISFWNGNDCKCI